MAGLILPFVSAVNVTVSPLHSTMAGLIQIIEFEGVINDIFTFHYGRINTCNDLSV